MEPMINLRSSVKLRFLLIVFFQLSFCLSFAQSYTIDRVEPPCWWVGMKNPTLQLMIHGEKISELQPVIGYTGVQVHRITCTTNPNYLFLTLVITQEAVAGSFTIDFQKGGVTLMTHPYALLEREPGSALRQGFDPSDVIYLITPDRFANGDPGNDTMDGYPDKTDRTDKDGRHGGDLNGIIDHLDYMADMGFTALWLNPVLENNMPRTSYHGYAITDFYRVDPRLGTNELYRQLGRQADEKGIKLIMDMVANHCGSEHWWMKDLPSADWIHGGGQFIPTNHRRTTVQDPHVSPSDRQNFPDGWFVEVMPDMNQQNPLLAEYLIQNSVWWIEYAHLRGIRQDTYSYPDKEFMSRWSCRIMEEYPGFSIVGEEWSENPAIVSYWQKGKENRDGYPSCLGSLMDFPLQATLVRGLNEDDAIYSDGLIKMYEMLANDFQYADPDHLVIFPDNHDMSRFFTQVSEDIDLFKMGLAYILTMRGIPQIYYGTEILMANPGTTDHGVIRSDFPGGWSDDMVNGFNGAGLTSEQAEVQLLMKKLLNWRKETGCVHSGKIVHYAPQNAVYVYFRYDATGKVMVVLNKNMTDVHLSAQRFREMTGDAVSARDVLTGVIHSLDHLVIPARSAMILELSDFQ
ncbi:MAG TPA: glycoside hydrolase family 13 protein [Bacteroidales bacterium]|nr:glycoside hydrolase family 13 protein [Bacteroidales bacterium]